MTARPLLGLGLVVSTAALVVGFATQTHHATVPHHDPVRPAPVSVPVAPLHVDAEPFTGDATTGVLSPDDVVPPTGRAQSQPQPHLVIVPV